MNLLITGAWQDALSYIPTLENSGHGVFFLQQESDIIPCDPAWIEGIICNGLFLYHPIELFSNLRYIQLTSAGFDRVPMDYIKTNDITILNARGVYSTPMAEFVVAEILKLYKGLDRFRDNQKAHRWEKKRDLQELAGQTVVIVGCGSVGVECAKRFKAFDCRVIGIDVVAKQENHFDSIKPINALDEALQLADIVVLTLPLTEETRGLINQDRLGLIHGILVNIARGAIINQEALMDWGGVAILDVFDDEPLAEDNPLWSKENFVITPHNSFIGNGNSRRLNDLIIHNLEGLRAL